jgi:hypothetical protein
VAHDEPSLLKVISAKHRSKAALSPVMVTAAVYLKNCSGGYKQTFFFLLCHYRIESTEKKNSSYLHMVEEVCFSSKKLSSLKIYHLYSSKILYKTVLSCFKGEGGRFQPQMVYYLRLQFGL